jgi:hypothetical protein
LPKKAFKEVEIHSGMVRQSRRDGTYFGGLSGQDLSRYDAAGPDPLSGAPRGKRLTEVTPVPGQRSTLNDSFPSAEPGAAHKRADEIKDVTAQFSRDLAEKILDEAGDHSAPDDRRALGIGTLPQQTEEH